MPLEFLGTSNLCCTDGTNRTFYVWAYLSEMGEIEGIHYGISCELTMASGIITRAEIDTDTRRKLWKFAENEIASGLVIEPFDDTSSVHDSHVTPFRRRQ